MNKLFLIACFFLLVTTGCNFQHYPQLQGAGFILPILLFTASAFSFYKAYVKRSAFAIGVGVVAFIAFVIVLWITLHDKV